MQGKLREVLEGGELAVAAPVATARAAPPAPAAQAPAQHPKQNSLRNLTCTATITCMSTGQNGHINQWFTTLGGRQPLPLEVEGFSGLPSLIELALGSSMQLREDLGLPCAFLDSSILHIALHCFGMLSAGQRG